MPFDVRDFYLLVLLSAKIHIQIQVSCSYSPRSEDCFHSVMQQSPTLEPTKTAVINLRVFFICSLNINLTCWAVRTVQYHPVTVRLFGELKYFLTALGFTWAASPTISLCILWARLQCSGWFYLWEWSPHYFFFNLFMWLAHKCLWRWMEVVSWVWFSVDMQKILGKLLSLLPPVWAKLNLSHRFPEVEGIFAFHSQLFIPNLGDDSTSSSLRHYWKHHITKNMLVKAQRLLVHLCFSTFSDEKS